MSVPAGVTQTFAQIGIREDLSDIIYDISPLDTPFLTMAKRGKATQVLHEWQTDTLATAGTNQQIQGDDASAATITATVRLANFCQISSKTVAVSGTSRAVRTAGRQDEFTYQIAKRGKEMKRDMEYALTRNQGSSAGGAGTANSLASVESWIATNKTSLGSGGTPTTPGYSGGTVAAPTDNSTQGSLNETALKSVIATVWAAGGDPTIAIVGPKNKQKISTAFAGIATQYRENSGTKQATILAAASVYISDFGELKIVPDRFSRENTVLILDMDYWSVDYLRPFKTWDLAKTGDSDKKQLLVEYTLASLNEKASGKVTDVANS